MRCRDHLKGSCVCNNRRLLTLIAASSVLVAHSARADIGLAKDGITDGYGFATEAVNVELYGVLDVGVGSLEHSYKGSDVFASTVNPYNLNSSPNSFTGIYTGGLSMSRLGLKGDKELGDVTVFFKLETAIDVTSGNLSNNGRSIYNNINGLTTANGASAIDGQWFSRAAYVGASHPMLGSLEFGRTTNFSLDQVVEYDPVQAALLYSPLGFSGGIGGGLGATENTRFDNSLKYENKTNLGEFGAVKYGFQYRFSTSRDDQEAESGYVAMLAYKNGPASLMGTYAQTYNTVAYATQYSNVVAPDPNLQIEDTCGFMITGKYEILTSATIKLGYESTNITPPSNLNLTGIEKYYGLTLPQPAVNAIGKQIFGTFWVGGDYRPIEDLDLSAGFYDIDTFNHPEIKKQYRSVAYSLLADYTIRRGLDTYVGAMLLDYSGIGLDHKAPILAYPHNAIYGAGVRVKF